jgi:hypothetical protein
MNTFLEQITPGQFEGILLYVIGAFSTTVVKLYYHKEWRVGLVGANGRWDSYEILLTILFVFFDHLIMAHIFLGFAINDSVLWFLAGLFLYGFTGRWGLEWLGSMRGTTIIKTHTEHDTESRNSVS